MKKLVVSLVVSSALVAVLIPSAVFAAQGPQGGGPQVEFGTICSYTAGQSVTLSQDCSSSSVITVNLSKWTWLAYQGTTSPMPAPAVGDAAAAFVFMHKGQQVAWKLEYSESAFVVAKQLFPGTYVSSTGDCTSGTLTTQGLGPQGTQSTFTTDGNTVYENGGQASTCATVTGAYAANEPLVVEASLLTTNTWYATRVNANPASSHRFPPTNTHVVFGTICSYTAGQSVTISQNCGSSSDVTVTLDSHTWLVYEGTTSPVPAPVVGDASAAYLRWNQKQSTAGELAYSENPFAFAHGVFAGDYVSSTGDCTSGTLTIQGFDAQATPTMFNTDASTVYETGGAPSTCATVTGAYATNEPILVLGNEITNGTWYATRINANPLRAHHFPRKNANVIFGTICSYTAQQSVTISQNCGSSSDVTVNLTKRTFLVYKGTTSPAPAPVLGDSAAAYLHWRGGKSGASELAYSENPFAFSKSFFAGTYVSSGGTCSSGTLTIQSLDSSATQTTFGIDSNTVYENAGTASTCATVTEGYAANEVLAVHADELTNATWYATTVNANARLQHHHK